MNRTALAVAAANARWGKRPIAERFWEKVDKSAGPDACWPWLASRNTLGYGGFSIGVEHRPIGAHRMAWILVHGDPGSAHVLHSCDNPPCCNPTHLSLGTHAENLRQAVVRGLFHIKVPDTHVIELRERVADGETVAAVARELGIEYSTAKKMVSGWLRPHVPGPLTRPRRRPTKVAA